MSTAYYYLAASLPVIHFESTPPMSHAEYLELCQRLMSPEDFNKIQKVSFDDNTIQETPSRDFLSEWRRFNQSLKNALVTLRAESTRREPLDYVRGERYTAADVQEAAAEAMKTSDPLEAEKLLDKFRWQRVDDLLIGHYFDVEFLMGYAIKLQILARYQEIASPRGQEKLEEYKKVEISV